MKPASLHLDALVEALARLQSTGAKDFAAGLFPAHRTHVYLGYAVPDDTLFPTAVIVYLLQQIRPHLSPGSQGRVDGVVRKAVAAYPAYRNNQGDPLYNFWPNVPIARFFPNGLLLHRFRLFHLPEDIDTTAYAYLTLPHADEDILWLKERLILDANGTRRRIRNTLPPYRSLRTYSTWLGEADMPIDFDVCALSNLLLFIYRYGLPLNEHDRDTLRFIRAVLDNDHAFTHPFAVAPWYANTSVILYHLARLIAACDVPERTALRDKLLRDLIRQHERTTVFMERILLSTSRMRLGEAPLVTQYPDDVEAAGDGFSFFIGSLLTAVDHPITWALAKYPLFHVRYHCPAHTLALLLEHEALFFLPNGQKK